MQVFECLSQISVHEIYLEVKGMMARIPEEDEMLAFNDFLGGRCKIAETLEDLKEIKDYETDQTILEGPLEFDNAFYLPSNQWVMLFDATNNAGGDFFFVPIELAKQVPNIGASVNKFQEIGLIQSFRGPLQEVTRISSASGVEHTRKIPSRLPITEDMDTRSLTWDETMFLGYGITEDENKAIAAGS